MQFDVQRYYFFRGRCAARGQGRTAGYDPEQGRLIEHYARLCDMQPFGLSANLEFMPWTAVNDLASALHIAEQADRANAGILVDALHFDRSDSRRRICNESPHSGCTTPKYSDGPALRPDTREGLIHAARCERLLPEAAVTSIWRGSGGAASRLRFRSVSKSRMTAGLRKWGWRRGPDRHWPPPRQSSSRCKSSTYV